MGEKALYHTLLMLMDPEQSCRCEMQVAFQAGALEQPRNVAETPSAHGSGCSWEKAKPLRGLQLGSG